MTNRGFENFAEKIKLTEYKNTPMDISECFGFVKQIASFLLWDENFYIHL